LHGHAGSMPQEWLVAGGWWLLSPAARRQPSVPDQSSPGASSCPV
jgi:hypothetical protein